MLFIITDKAKARRGRSLGNFCLFFSGNFLLFQVPHFKKIKQKEFYFHDMFSMVGRQVGETHNKSWWHRSLTYLCQWLQIWVRLCECNAGSSLTVWALQLWANLEYPGMPSDPRKLKYFEPSTPMTNVRNTNTANTAFPKPGETNTIETWAESMNVSRISLDCFLYFV
jgi:hypothetical protein